MIIMISRVVRETMKIIIIFTNVVIVIIIADHNDNAG